MDNLSIYCMCLDNSYLNIVKKLNYIPVGLKSKNFSDEWLLDNTLDNISKKILFMESTLLLLVLEEFT